MIYDLFFLFFFTHFSFPLRKNPSRNEGFLDLLISISTNNFKSLVFLELDFQKVQLYYGSIIKPVPFAFGFSIKRIRAGVKLTTSVSSLISVFFCFNKTIKSLLDNNFFPESVLTRSQRFV